MKKNAPNIIFICIFMLILVVPFATMNFKPNQTSDIDNKVLTEFPEITASSETVEALENYVDDRVGFREKAIELYTAAVDKVFRVMIHPLFMYGKDGHIFYKDPNYIAAYQRLNTDEEYLNSLTEFLSETKTYLDGKDIRFLYFLCPDKKTIYPEFFPDSVHVKEDEKTVISVMRDNLSKTDVEYVIPDAELLKAKESQVIYNKMYDATHWNEFGSFIGQKLLDQHVQNWFSDVKPLSEEDFTLEFVTMENLDTSDFPINDQVPVYSLKVDTSQDATFYLEPSLRIPTKTFYAHFMNPEVTNGKILLVFTDSYFATYHKYYNNRFSEVYYVHRQNSDYLQYMVNLVIPNVVVFETAERSITSEMPVTSDFSDYYYEPAYENGKFNLADINNNTLDLSYSITETDGVTVDNNTIFIAPESPETIACVCGVMNNYADTKNLDIYAKIEGNYFETDYNSIHKLSEEEGVKRFEFSVQRRYLAPSQIDIVAVDRNTNTEYLIDTFEVEYAQ